MAPKGDRRQVCREEVSRVEGFEFGRFAYSLHPWERFEGVPLGNNSNGGRFGTCGVGAGSRALSRSRVAQTTGGFAQPAQIETLAYADVSHQNRIW